MKNPGKTGFFFFAIPAAKVGDYFKEKSFM